MAERPLGVTIIGILWILNGLLWLVLGFLGGAALAVIGLGVLGAAVGIILIIVGLIFLFLGIGCFKGWGWVWIVGVILTAIGVLMGIVSLFTSWVTGLFSIIIGVIILWYLFQPQVKAYFGNS